jgi:uncharacterized protein (TIGR02687 family)
MLSDTIQLRLTERFAAPLPDFHKRRVVFWRDEDGEFAEQWSVISGQWSVRSKDLGQGLEGDARGPGYDSLNSRSACSVFCETDCTGSPAFHCPLTTVHCPLTTINCVALTGRNSFAVKKLLTADDLTGDYLIYDPLSYGSPPTDDWLLDIKLYSEEFRADLVSIQMEELNIEPNPAMRKTVKQYAKFLENKERKAKLRKIGRDYHTPAQFHSDVMAVLCGLNGGSAQDVIIAVLSAGLDEESNAAIDNITRFGNIEAFRQMVQRYTGFDSAEWSAVSEQDDENKQQLAAHHPLTTTHYSPLTNLACHVLVTALSQTMNPALLKGLERFISESNKAYCYQLVKEWESGVRDEKGKKNYSQIPDTYSLHNICRRVEQELRLPDRFDNIEIDALLRSDTFPAIGESILKRYFTEINERIIKVEPILEAVENRRTAAWYSLTANYYDCLYYIAKMQEFHLAHIEGFHIVEPAKIWRLYTKDAYEMDSHYRHFHAAFAGALKAPNAILEEALQKCSDVVEGLYREWYLKQLTDSWTKAIAGDLELLGYVSEINKQREFYRRYVSSNVSRGNRTFVIISDALRYEVAAELAERLSRATKGKASLEAAQAIFPGVTKFGMAALLPGKELSAGDKIEALMDGQSTDTTARRGAILAAANKNSTALTYKDFIQMSKQERRDACSGKEVIYIYHNAIDAVGDKAVTEAKVFEACETAMSEIESIVNRIVNDLSGIYICITADHGFLYTYKPLDENSKLSRQTFDGEVLELGRRYALAPPETTADYLLPVKTEREIGGIPMKGYAPQDAVRIKVQGGGENYVHGGISLQEMVVPVIVYKGMRSDRKKYIEVKNPGLTLISVSRKVSNLMFSLDFLQQQPIGDKVQPCAYKLCFTDEAGATVSDVQTVIADRKNDNASERVFSVRFTLKQMSYDHNRIYRLVIKNDTDVPEEVEFRFDIAFADDFGFDV